MQDMLRTLSMVFEPIDLSPAFAEQERDIILREYDFRLGSNPDGKAAEDAKAFLYDGNIDAVSVLGTPAEIRAMTYEAAKDLHAATHRPELARLVVIGDVSAGELRAAMDEAGFPSDFGTAPVSPPEFELQGPDSRIFSYPLADVVPRMAWRRVVTLPEPVDFDLLDVQTSLLRDILDTNLPGGIAGPLRFARPIARSFSVSVWPIDEDNVEISFTAEPDAGVSFAKLQSAFEAALAVSAEGIPSNTYQRVHKRFRDYWPDWADEAASSQWMADYVLRRVGALREPLTEDQLKALAGKVTERDINALLKSLVGPGRTAVTRIGKDQDP